jgi:putative DNA primase/helicase
VVDCQDPTFALNLSKQVHQVAAKLCEGTKNNAVGRVAKRFALLQVSLGLAHKYELLPFPVEQIEWSVAMCFRDWLAARGGDGSIEIKQAIERIEHLLVTNEFSDRVMDLRDGDTKTIRNLLAYRKVGLEKETEEFWVPPTVFDKEFAMGVNKAELVKELQRLGWLAPAAYDGNPSVKRRFNGKQIRVFVFLPLSQNSNFKGASPASPASLDETVTGTEVSPGNTEAP